MAIQVLDTDPIRRVELALEDIREGRMVILVDDEDRENEGDLTMAASMVTPEAINFMATHGRGLICLTLTSDQVDRLQLPMMAANNQSPYHTAFTVSIEAREGVSTGISAADRARTIQVAIDPENGPADIVTPGHVFPLRARDGGVLVRTGQTEGSVDLARLAGLPSSGVICEIMKDDGTMARMPDLEVFGTTHGIRIVTVEDLIRYRMRKEVLVDRVMDTTVQLEGLGEFRMCLHRASTEDGLHLSLSLGDIDDGQPVLTRVAAFCPTGDLLGSLSCDCKNQLHGALKRIQSEGRGILLYMHVNGGVTDSLLARIRSHNGLLDAKAGAEGGGELRELGMGAQILVDLGAHRLRLMTNNPRKIVGLEGYGLEVVERVSITTPEHEANAAFLEERRDQLGHILPERTSS
jgi:3,4-dihydroxy 2-butanone 4-phosphate synthase/GTP cyclohydrolase II